MLYVPSIFVQRPQARPSSLRQAPLCGWAPDEALSWHRHQSPPTFAGAPVPGGGGRATAAAGVPSRSEDELEHLSISVSFQGSQPEIG